ncbi:hypothetical protein IAR50_005413 [Cryptococcus sp. DSM 104548]
MSSDLPGVRQKVIGLVSGGKDSCFNLMHCIANGHEIVALATLTPEDGIDELDSHLYQSVGTHLLPLLAKSMGIPLFTGIIRGKAVEKGPEYGSRLRGGEGSGEKGDETEDLTFLLQGVLAKHPDATALASGAILSTYQRIRIEHVCGRLGLTSLSYLWQSEQGPLLDKMLGSGVEAVIMKVAGVGLGPKIVGKQLGAIMPLLSKLEAQYGSHPAGEGGEYETLTLSTPLFSHRLKLVETEVIVTDPEPYPVAYLKVKKAELEEKPGWQKPSVSELREMLGLDAEPGLAGLDEEGQERLEELGQRFIEPIHTELTLESLQVEDKEESFEVQFAKRGRWFTAGVQGQTLPDQDVGAELKFCFDAISNKLQSQNLSLPLHAAHITLLLSDMSLFLSANAIYKSYFGTSPPSRATVAVPLTSGRVRVEVMGFDDTPLKADGGKVGGRSALHVQGLSYWAPANIGPYSQAVLVSSRLHLAGQIPLIPASLTLPPPPPAPSSPYPHQATLALQHVGKILNVMRSKNSTGGGWEGWVESVVGWWASTSMSGGGGEGVGVARDAWRIWAARNGATQAPALFVQAKELPKGALVEYQVNLHTGRRDQTLLSQRNNDDDDDDDELQVAYEKSTGEDIWWESSKTVGKDLGCRGVVFAKGVDVNALVRSSGPNDAKLALLLAKAVSLRVYHTPSLGPAQIHSLLPSLSQAAFTLIPVVSIHDRQGESVPLALEVFGI